MKRLFDDLPAVYRRLIPESQNLTIPEEAFATCGSCAMASGSCRPGERSFQPTLKCCTYFPGLPNYLVGALLSEQDVLFDEGRERVSHLIKARRGVFPLGIHPPRSFHALYKRGSELGFGNSNNLLCPYFIRDGGKCGIWRFRESVCSTYFCKTVAGKAGKAFWDAVKAYLSAVERACVMHVLAELKLPGASALVERVLSGEYSSGPLSPNDLDGVVDPLAYSADWAAWEGRERDFYMESYDIVKSLTPKDVERIAGLDLHYKWLTVKRRHADSNELPGVLVKAHPEMARSPSGKDYVAWSSQAKSTLEVPVRLVDAFDGRRNTSEILRSLQAEGLDVEDDIVIALYHAGTLKAVRGPAATEDSRA